MCHGPKWEINRGLRLCRARVSTLLVISGMIALEAVISSNPFASFQLSLQTLVKVNMDFNSTGVWYDFIILSSGQWAPDEIPNKSIPVLAENTSFDNPRYVRSMSLVWALLIRRWYQRASVNVWTKYVRKRNPKKSENSPRVSSGSNCVN